MSNWQASPLLDLCQSLANQIVCNILQVSLNDVGGRGVFLCEDNHTVGERTFAVEQIPKRRADLIQRIVYAGPEMDENRLVRDDLKCRAG